MVPWKQKSWLGTQRFLIRSSLSISLAIGLGSAQTFNSGSNGSDGAFVFNDSGTFEFNPNSFNPPLDPDGDGIFHFTTITVGPNSKLKLTARYLNGPVYWLATGAVLIRGDLDLSGEDGHPTTINVGQRLPSVPGAGGYPGGMGGSLNSNWQTGAGPQGGSAFRGDGRGSGAGFGGNNFCVPLIGGSGGAGAWYHNNWSGSGYYYRGGGGAGGGAILVASSLSISITGNIRAHGGYGGDCCGEFTGGGGTGGSIRLIAPTLTGNGRIGAGYGHTTFNVNGSWGRVRLESFNNQYSGDFYCQSLTGRNLGYMPAGTIFRSHPTNSFLPSDPPPVIRVKSIAGIALPNTPTASFAVPDVAINTATSVTVEIEAKRVPPGSKPQLTIYSENGADQNFNAPDLVGNDSLSTCTIPVVFPPGYSRGYVRVSWTQ